MTVVQPSERMPPSHNPVPPPRTHVHALARWCIRPLLKTSISPSHLTTLRLLTGLAAAGCFAFTDYALSALGGVLFAISALLDRADGELARLSGRTSQKGHWYDLSSDMVVNVMAFIGIGFGLSDHIASPWAPAMGLIAGLSVGAIFIVVFRLHSGGSNPIVAFRYPHKFDFDDALFIVPVFAWFDALLPLMITAVIGAPLFLLFALWRFRKVQLDPVR
jgi:archaetidylinositol phosphate synthase